MIIDTLSVPFLYLWNNAMIIGVVLCVAIALLIFIVYKVRVGALNGPKEKYDYINENEIRWYKYIRACLKTKKVNKYLPLGVVFLIFNARKNE